MDARNVADTLGVIGAEGALFTQALEQAEQARTRSEHLLLLDQAIDHGFGILELAGRLRTLYPDKADRLARLWRTTLLRVRDEQARICRSAIRSRQ